ncbi:MAG: right-handed parallel beta-helix repeat-containing protein [Candidatus Thorarchaeota archaeon]
MDLKEKRILGGIFIIIFLLIFSSGSVFFFLLSGPDREDLDFRIRILSDSDFLEYGFPGNGSRENPYRIENYTISTSQNHAICIYYITKYIIIRNNDITAKRYGIYIYHVPPNHTHIENNVIHDCHYGIEINYCPRSVIHNNTFYNNDFDIYLRLHSDHSIITNNICYRNNGNSISNSRNAGVLFENNSVIFPKGFSSRNGIFLSSALNNSIRNNYFENCGLHISMEDFSYYHTLLIDNNYLNGEPFNYTVILNKNGVLINATKCHQLDLVNCTNTEIFDGNFSSVDYGIFIRNCSATIIKESLFKYIGAGIRTSLSKNTTIRNCNFMNSYRGIYTFIGFDILITNCTFLNCPAGCYLVYSDAFVRNNTFKDNSIGCSFIDCGYEPHIKANGFLVDFNCTMTNNIFRNNTNGCLAKESICLIKDNTFWLSYVSLFMKGYDHIGYITNTTCNVINNHFRSNYISIMMEFSEAQFIDNYIGNSTYGIYYSSDSYFSLFSVVFEDNDEDLYQYD